MSTAKICKKKQFKCLTWINTIDEGAKRKKETGEIIPLMRFFCKTNAHEQAPSAPKSGTELLRYHLP